MVSPTRIKIFGERNTGTNYAEQLLAANLGDVLVRGTVPPAWMRIAGSSEFSRDCYFRLTERRNLGWKHRSVAALVAAGRNPRLIFVTLVKNPYSWLLSLHRRPYHQVSAPKSASFEDFIDAPWHCRWRDRAGAAVLASPVELWNLKNRSYADLVARCGGVLLRYEDLLTDPEAAVRSIAAAAGRTLAAPFRNIEAATKSDAGTFAGYRDYYLQERWASRLSASAVARINARLDLPLTAALGYSVRT